VIPRIERYLDHTVDPNPKICPLELSQLHSIPPPPLVNQQAETSEY
jgi:hypothetical protein